MHYIRNIGEAVKLSSELWSPAQWPGAETVSILTKWRDVQFGHFHMWIDGNQDNNDPENNHCMDCGKPGRYNFFLIALELYDKEKNFPNHYCNWDIYLTPSEIALVNNPLWKVGIRNTRMIMERTNFFWPSKIPGFDALTAGKAKTNSKI